MYVAKPPPNYTETTYSPLLQPGGPKIPKLPAQAKKFLPTKLEHVSGTLDEYHYGIANQSFYMRCSGINIETNEKEFVSTGNCVFIRGPSFITCRHVYKQGKASFKALQEKDPKMKQWWMFVGINHSEFEVLDEDIDWTVPTNSSYDYCIGTLKKRAQHYRVFKDYT